MAHNAWLSTMNMSPQPHLVSPRQRLPAMTPFINTKRAARVGKRGCTSGGNGAGERPRLVKAAEGFRVAEISSSLHGSGVHTDGAAGFAVVASTPRW